MCAVWCNAAQVSLSIHEESHLLHRTLHARQRIDGREIEREGG
jgi:hypothetical protein